MSTFRVGQLVRVKRDRMGQLINTNNHSYDGDVIYKMHQVDDDGTCKLAHPDTGVVGNWIPTNSLVLAESPDWQIIKGAISSDERAILELTEFQYTCTIETHTKSEVVLQQRDALMLMLAAADQIKSKPTIDTAPRLDLSDLDTFLNN